MRGLRRFAVAHWPFMVVLAGAAAVRVVALGGYPGPQWFGDSPEYLRSAIDLQPGITRPSGYPFLLWLLKPFHGFFAVLVVQHLLGLATGALVYAVIWRAGRAAWPDRRQSPGLVAAPLTIPALYPTRQVTLEHMLTSDGLFSFLIVATLTVVLWRRRMSWRAGAAAGALLGLAALTRSLALPLLAAFVVGLLIRRAGRRAAVAMIVASVLPVAAYMGWVRAEHGVFSFGKADGVWLYYRTADFADCAAIRPRPELAIMCPPNPADPRVSRSYISTWSSSSSFHKLPGGVYGVRANALAGEFARKAIERQPGDYVRVVVRDTFRAFRWEREPYPAPWAVDDYEWPVGESWPYKYAQVASGYAGDGRPRVVEPYAGWMLAYQRRFDMPGTFLGGILLAGLGGALARVRFSRPARTRASGGPRGLLAARTENLSAVLPPWTISVALLVIPAATADFDHRYVLPAVPPACLAAGLALISAKRPSALPAEQGPTRAGHHSMSRAGLGRMVARVKARVPDPR